MNYITPFFKSPLHIPAYWTLSPPYFAGCNSVICSYRKQGFLLEHSVVLLFWIQTKVVSLWHRILEGFCELHIYAILQYRGIGIIFCLTYTQKMWTQRSFDTGHLCNLQWSHDERWSVGFFHLGFCLLAFFCLPFAKMEQALGRNCYGFFQAQFLHLFFSYPP